MAEQASSILGVAIRVTRLAPSGAPALGAEASYVTSKFVSLSFTPEFEAGDEFTQKAANGTVCASLKAPDTLKRINLSIALCAPDFEFQELIAGGTLLEDAGTVVGYKAPAIGVDATPNGVCIEVWSQAVIGGKKAGVDPYFHWIFPYAQMHMAGDRVIENGMMASNFEGWAVGNPAYGTGVAAITTNKPVAPWSFGTESAMAGARTDAAPAIEGYNAVGPTV